MRIAEATSGRRPGAASIFPGTRATSNADGDSPRTAIALRRGTAAAFRPRRWRGALLPDRARVAIEVREADKRPVAATADHFEIRRVARVEVETDHATSLVLLHDPGHSLDERILREQFGQ